MRYRNRQRGGRGSALLFVTLMLLLSCFTGARAQSDGAQAFTVMLRNVPLDLALAQLSTAAGVNLIYDSRLVENINVICVRKDASTDELLRCVLNGTGLDYFQTSSGTYVLTESTRQPPRYGQFVGVVVDGASGEPLPYANVLLTDVGVGTAANEAGLFSFSMLKPGPYRVVTTYVGYEPKIDSVWIVPGPTTRERFALNARSVTAEPILITGLDHRVPSQSLGHDRLSEADLSDGSNSFGAADVSSSTIRLPGFTAQEPWADLHLQGGAAGELQMRLDGIPLRNPVTLGQLLGAFSPLAIERMTSHKAGFGVTQGSHLSGSISAEHALTRTEHRYVTARFDPLSFNARGQASWQAGRDIEARAMAAARTSLWSVFQDPTLQVLLEEWHTIDPLLTPAAHRTDVPAEAVRHRAGISFSDVHGAVRVHFSPFHTIHASFYRGDNNVESEAAGSSDPAASLDNGLTRDTYRWSSTGGQIRYEGLLGERILGTLAAYSSRTFLGHGYLMPAPVPDAYYEPISYVNAPYDGNWVDETGIEAGIDVNLARRHHLTGNLAVTRTASRVLIHNDFFRQVDHSSAQWRFSGYIQDEASLGLRTSLEIGTRLTYIPDRQTVYAEPRLALRYDGHHNRHGDYTLRFASGVYRQFVNEFDVSSTGPMALLPFVRFWLPVDNSLVPPRAYHFAGDLLWKPEGPWQVNVEGYYKWQPHLLAINYPELLYHDRGNDADVDHAAFIGSTDGRAFGGDVRVRYTSSDLNSTVSYSLMRSLRRFPERFDGREQPTPWEQPHRVMVQNTVAFTPQLTLNLDWRGVWGRSWAFRRAYYDYLLPKGEMVDLIPYDLNNPSEQQLPPLYQLDAGMSYERDWSGFSLLFSAKILNVLDRRNAFDWSLRETDDGFERTIRSLPGRRPVFSLRLSF